jgi:hypothetical protein
VPLHETQLLLLPQTLMVPPLAGSQRAPSIVQVPVDEIMQREGSTTQEPGFADSGGHITPEH